MAEDNSLVIEWIKEATKEMREGREQNIEDHKEMIAEMTRNREDFVIFKTKVNVRTAMISSGIGLVAIVLSIILNFGSIKERQAEMVEDHTHQVETVK